MNLRKGVGISCTFVDRWNGIMRCMVCFFYLWSLKMLLEHKCPWLVDSRHLLNWSCCWIGVELISVLACRFTGVYLRAFRFSRRRGASRAQQYFYIRTQRGPESSMTIQVVTAATASREWPGKLLVEWISDAICCERITGKGRGVHALRAIEFGEAWQFLGVSPPTHPLHGHPS